MFIGVAIAFVSAIYFAFNDQWKGMTGMLGATAMFLFFMNLDRIAEFEWLGGKAKTREIVDEARATIEQLRHLAVVFADATITGLIASGRWGGSGADTQVRIRDELIKILRELEVDDAGIEKAQESYVKYLSFYHAQKVLDFSPDRPSSSEVTDRWNELQGRSEVEGNLPTPEEFESFFEDCGILNQATRECIEDYRYFLKHHEVRNMERFLSLRP